ncbi:MAG: putative DNA binding domain-containing protein [Bacteroidetes bacterium]|nr:putative DNA binding domain-containing protein [Bacteroidota bacterium]MCY4204155.1 putative DNA binding domain-containing protein [Bacteroidota bacterium]
MLNTPEEIEQQLAAGEDSLVEFKEVILGSKGVRSPNSEAFAGEMIAFANANGGTVLLGVDDEGIVQGLPETRIKDVEDWVINVATNNCEPPIEPVLTKRRLSRPDGNRTTVLLVRILRGLFVHATNTGRHYVRVGSSKQILSGPRLVRLFQNRGQAIIFDEQPVPTATQNDLDQTKLKHYFKRGPKAITWIDLLRNTRITSPTEDGLLCPTVAGLLIFSEMPQNHLPSAFIEAAVYRGTRRTSDELVHAESIKGCVGTQIEGAIKFVDRFMLRPARKPLGRVDYPQFNIHAVYEAVVNAVAHRDYSIRGSKIRLFLYSDRLEISSPGGLPNTLTLKTMAFRVFTRNQLLVNFLSRMISPITGNAFLESRGEGIETILDLSETHSGRVPEYNLYGDELLLTIWGKPSPHES